MTNRRGKDYIKLIQKGYNVELVENRVNQFVVDFNGPPESLYEGYIWKVMVVLEIGYPEAPPYIYFKTKILHPNIAERGLVCISALTQREWDPHMELESVFEFMLPILLQDPNFEDPFNLEAADLHLHSPEEYKARVRAHCKEHAIPNPEEPQK